MPNRVSCNGSNEITLQTIVSSINAIEFERGGIAWGAALPYQPGDLVSLDLAGPGMYELYRCVAPHTSVDITIPAEFANWELVTSLEIGGVHYKGAADYNIGDIVTAEVDNGVDPIFTSVYRCTTLYTSGAGTPAGFFAEIANWEEVSGENPHGYIATTGSTFTPDFETDDFFDCTMTTHSNFQPPLNLEVGKLGTLFVRQDAVGGWQPFWSANYKFPDNVPIIDTSPNALNVFEYKAIAADTILIEFVASHIPTPITITTIIQINDFSATDTLPGEIEMTFTEQ